MKWDDMRRMTRMYSTSGGTTKAYLDSMAYDVDGRLTRVDDENTNDTTYQYDSDTGRLTKAVLGYLIGNSAMATHVLRYDRPGRLTRHESDVSTAWNYYYDNSRGVLTALSSSNGQGLSAGSSAYGYDDDGRLTRLDLRNGAYTTWAYDAGARVTKRGTYMTYGGSGISVVDSISYDAATNITKVEHDDSTNNMDVTQTYEYDAVNRVTRPCEARQRLAHRLARQPDQDLRLRLRGQPNGDDARERFGHLQVAVRLQRGRPGHGADQVGRVAHHPRTRVRVRL